ncbi:MAG: pyrimidine dimer DNA glycosylase/endonuclease V [Betaproteobacteria bacterium]|nr:pyrimidine dimer DNA glycosylase/endonuclease V [Betaproteobacteria bacterium]
MRLWSIHPKYLDSKGLVALWREGLLAQNVLLGKTTGYKNHPQLIRFKDTGNQAAAIASYLKSVVEEADIRGYNFNRSKINNMNFKDKILATNGQIQYEFEHLLKKIKKRDNELFRKFKKINNIEPHPLFNMVIGDIEDWEIV